MRYGLAILGFAVGCQADGPSIMDDPMPGTDPGRADDTDVLVDTDDPVLPGSSSPFGDTAVTPNTRLAGTWRDLDAWEFWEDLTGSGPYEAAHDQWGFDTRQRFHLQVTAGGQPVCDAEVKLMRTGELVWTGRTDVRGDVDLFGGLFDGAGGPWDLVATKDVHVLQRLQASPRGAEIQEMELTDTPIAKPSIAEVVWVIDRRPTDMPWLDWAQDRLPDVAVAIQQATSGQVALQSRVASFDARGAEVGAWGKPSPILGLSDLETGVGGSPALALTLDTLAQLDWADEARARLAVLLLSAEDLRGINDPLLHDATERLAALGVRLVPIQADPDGGASFLFRDLAVATGGTWSFLLDDARDEASDLVGDHPIDVLDGLLVDTVLHALDL